MAVTIKDIAAAANVSTATVSLALKDNPRIAEKTRQRIGALAKTMGYVPNSFARSLQSNHSKLIGYLLPNPTTSFYDELIQAISTVLTENGYGLLTAITDETIPSERLHLSMFRQKRVDGIILSTLHAETIGEIQDFERNDVPVVSCDFDLEGLSAPCVRMDDIQATRIATEYLIELGHSRLAYCFGTNPCSWLRYRAYAEAAARADLPMPCLCEKEEDLRRQLASSQRPTAIVAFSDFDAIKSKHIAESASLRVPDDISIVGFDDVFFSGWGEFGLTTIAQPKQDIGRMAAEMLLGRIQGKDSADILLPPSLIKRTSCTDIS